MYLFILHLFYLLYISLNLSIVSSNIFIALKITSLLVISIPASVLVVIGILLILFFNLRKRKKTLIKEEVTPLVDETAYFAFGGKDNIKSVELKGSRLVIELFDQSKFVKDAIKDYGIDRVLVMSNKITLVGTNVNKLYELINN